MKTKIEILAVIFSAALFCIVSASPIQIHAGFEMLGTTEGKIFVRPIYGPGSDNLTYQDAIAKCHSAGYKIATLESQAQNDVVEPSSRWSWIDGIDLQTPDVFFSINTGRNLTYFNWTKWGQRPIIGKDDNNCIRISCNSGDC
ncbi:Mannose-binding protein C, partial [Orchesella cincta]